MKLKFFFFLLFFVGSNSSAASAIDTLTKTQVRSRDDTMINVWVMHPESIKTENQTRPVVVALHGCGGLYATSGARKGELNARHQGMANILLQQGYSVVWPDSLTTRNETSLCNQKFINRKIKQTHRRDDVDGVLDWLSTQAWVDERKVALLGWSHGGSAVLVSTDSRETRVPHRSIQPDVAIAFYPGCTDSLNKGYRSEVDLLLLLAELDDWTPPGPCLELAKITKAKVNVYPNSYHGFDNPVGTVKLRTDVPNGVNPGRGVHSGRNPQTGPQSWQDVTGFLKLRWNP
jgi:dienelactone hydrolase